MSNEEHKKKEQDNLEHYAYRGVIALLTVIALEIIFLYLKTKYS